MLLSHAMPTPANGRYHSPFTKHGQVLGELGPTGLATFHVHECGYLPRGIRWHFPGVLSPFWRLYFNGKPGWHVRHAGRDHALGPDRLVLIADGTLFDCLGEPGVPHLWLHFNPLRRGGPSPEAPITRPLTPLLRAAVESVLSAHAETDEARRRSRLYHATAALLHATFGEFELSAPPDAPPRLEQLLRFIDAHLADDLTNPQLARQAALSESAFIRWFREHLGVTPAIWVQQARVKQAARSLVLTAATIDAIAADCGFPNRFYFSRVFQRHMRCGPAEYRRRQVRPV